MLEVMAICESDKGERREWMGKLSRRKKGIVKHNGSSVLVAAL